MSSAAFKDGSQPHSDVHKIMLCCFLGKLSYAHVGYIRTFRHNAMGSRSQVAITAIHKMQLPEHLELCRMGHHHSL